MLEFFNALQLFIYASFTSLGGGLMIQQNKSFDDVALGIFLYFLTFKKNKKQ